MANWFQFLNITIQNHSLPTFTSGAFIIKQDMLDYGQLTFGCFGSEYINLLLL